MVSVPSKDSLSDAGKSGAMGGVPAGIGALAGRSFLGPGLGTAAGGIAGASMLSGDSRTNMAETAVFVGLTEMGGSSGGSSSGGNGGVM